MPSGLEKMQSVMILNSKGYVNSRESATVEFKESFNWDNKAEYGKIMAAFANNCGGIIIFGVKDKPKVPVGLLSDSFEKREPEKISEYLKSKFSTYIQFESELYEFNDKNFGYIYVHPATTRPVICIANDGKDQELKDGEIYFRNGARSDRIDSANLQRLIEEEKQKERTAWQDLFSRVSKVGVENATVLNLKTGEISDKGGTIIIDESLLPQLKFIKEGYFTEKEGAPALKLLGELKTSAQVIEKEVIPENIYIYSTKELGVKLGFPQQNATANALALAKYFRLQSKDYMHIFNISRNNKPKKYSQSCYEFLKAKMDQGDFTNDPESESMKMIRREAQQIT